MSAIPKVLVPITIDSTMVTASSISEPASGETAWVSSGTYAVADIRYLAATHKLYKCTQAHTGRTNAPNTASELGYYWQDIGATQRYAAFDNLVNTKSTGTTTITYTILLATFINSVAFYGLSNVSTVRVVVKDGAGGTVVYDQTTNLIYPGLGFWEYYHTAATILDRCVMQSIPLVSAPEVSITLTGATGTTIGVGMIAIGDLRPLFDTTTWGGTQFGSQAKPTTYSYIKTDDYGVTSIIKRGSSTDMSIKVEFPHGQADYALATVQSVLDIPAAWVGTDEFGYAGLNVFGLASGTLTYQSYNLDVFSIDVRGFI